MRQDAIWQLTQERHKELTAVADVERMLGAQLLKEPGARAHTAARFGQAIISLGSRLQSRMFPTGVGVSIPRKQ